MRPSSRPHGFTLVELLIGTAVGALVLLAVGLAFISQAQQYQAHASRRAIQASARQGMAFVERTARRAGFGVDPDRAIIPYDSFDAATNTQAAGFPDAVAFHARDPLFSRLVQKVEPGRLELATPLSEDMYQGQILLLLCPGAVTYTYVTVGMFARAGDTVIALDHSAPGVDSPMGPPGVLFRDAEGHLNPVSSCFTGAEPPTVVKVERTAFYIASFDEDGDPSTPGLRPYLMLHRGLDIAGGADGQPDGVIDARDAVPLADGIEQLQAAYILNTIHSTDPSQEKQVPAVVGVVDDNLPATGGGGVRPWPFGEQWALTSTADRPSFQDAYDSPRRMTAHPANIRQVRLTLVARSTVPDSAFPGDDALTPGAAWGSGGYDGTTTWAQLENLGTAPDPKYDPRGGGYYRVVLRQAITPKNLLSRSQFLPISPGGG